jgi:hypothetical protein
MESFLKYIKKTILYNHGLGGASIFEHWKIYNEWQEQIISKKQPFDCELPWISIHAKNYLKKYLEKKDKQHINIFEYGSGGSSLFFLKYSNNVISIEHNPEWFHYVRNAVADKKIKGWHGELIKPDPIENNLQVELDSSNPLDYYSTDESSLMFTFKNYASSIDKYPDNYFDLILVDGRSRPSCLYHSRRKLKSGGLLVLDNADRKYYLSGNLLDKESFNLVLSLYGAAVCFNEFIQTNVYSKK